MGIDLINNQTRFLVVQLDGYDILATPDWPQSLLGRIIFLDVMEIDIQKRHLVWQIELPSYLKWDLVILVATAVSSLMLFAKIHFGKISPLNQLFFKSR